MFKARRWIISAVALIALPLTGCGGGDGAPTAAPSSAKPTRTTQSSPAPTPAPDRDGDGVSDPNDTYPDDPENKPPQPTVMLECYRDGSYSERDMLDVVVDPSGKPDFAPVWATKHTDCSVVGFVVPISDFEKSVYETSKYEDNDISTLYEICADVEPSAYSEDGYAASESQIPELSAALLLCPKHPFAAKWQQAIQQGKTDLKLTEQGRLFGAGTFLVGEEIRSGTYVTKDVEGCYWERQNKSGDIIDNNFIISARRVQVTIRSSDYAFHSQGCGEWRPAR